MKTKRQFLHLKPHEVEEFGREMDAIRDEVFADRGDRDRRYILKLIKTQRSFDLAGRVIIYLSLFFVPLSGFSFSSWGLAVACLAMGAITLGLGKILENMEIAHNVLHGQWDWMKDPNIQSNTWEWDTMSPSDRWMHSHNVVHHTWTNVIGKDLDVGYGIIRVTADQPWGVRYILQPVYAFLLMVLFEEGVALHEQSLIDVLEKGKPIREVIPQLKHIAQKAFKQIVKDYIMWPSVAALAAWGLGANALIAFLLVAGANALANVIRNIWAFMIIFCGHFPSGVAYFAKEQLDGETRAEWYLRQLHGSANIGGGRLFHILSGNLSHQIEHHLFPDMCSNRYPEVAPRVRALAARYGLSYNTGSLAKQFGSTVWKILRLSMPGGKSQTIASV
jgi:fatty acid desaturase